jgi:hypothetical protein
VAAHDKTVGEHWGTEPEAHDYPAALSYLSLLMDPSHAKHLVDRLQRVSELQHFKAKDILRASGLPLLDENNAHVRADLAKVASGKPLSPVLLVRGMPLLIADGYHRICASYWLDENADIPSRIVSPHTDGEV